MSFSWLLKPFILVFVVMLSIGLFKTGEASLKESITALQSHSHPSSIELESVTLKRVVDGDTIIVLD